MRVLPARGGCHQHQRRRERRPRRAVARARTTCRSGVSTDKACKPINVMGMTKAVQERVLVEGNLGQDHCRMVAVRNGNVIGSRGSVIPLFRHQIASRGPVTITDSEMTRFLLSLDQAVDAIFARRAGGSTGRDLRGPDAFGADHRRRHGADRGAPDRARGNRHPPRREAARGADLRGGGAAHHIAAAPTSC